MQVVLLSGGSGKRLWPLSNDSRSKQFLKVLPDENGVRESMVQRVWNQLTKAGLEHNAYISTGRAQVEMLYSQLGEGIPLIIEPERRDTFPAIALAAVYLYSVKEVDENEIVCVLPVDVFAENPFFNDLHNMASLIHKDKYDLVLMGAQPTYPSAKYGYIVPDHRDLQTGVESCRVLKFVEKPNEHMAKELLQQHALWNCGVFGFRLGYIIDLLREWKLPLEYKLFIENYETMQMISFDYAVVERTNNIGVIPYSGQWKDLGTWNTLTEEMPEPLIGTAILSTDSTNTHVINELGIPIVVLGLNGIVVAASPDGILVSDKAASPRLKDLVSEFDRRLMYEERLWGWYRVLEYSKQEDGQEVLTRRVCLFAGKHLSYQVHRIRSETWMIVRGKGELITNGVLRNIHAGDVISLPVGIKHALKATTQLELIEVQIGSELVEEDVTRLAITWAEILDYCSSEEGTIQ